MDAENINHTAAMTAKGACKKSEAIVLQAASGGCFIGAGAAGAFLVPTHPWILLVAAVVGLASIAISVRRVRELHQED